MERTVSSLVTTATAGDGLCAPPCVLDTNVVLDWLVFEEPSGLALGAAIMQEELRWLVTPPMQAELVEVLARLRSHPPLQRWQSRERPALAMLAAWAQPTPAPAPLPPHRQARCSDPDDQIFIDLAVAHGAPWLFTRDRAVLRLARRLHAWGVAVVTPARWHSARARPGPAPTDREDRS
jgi:predicted nucleic acid-binding protein